MRPEKACEILGVEPGDTLEDVKRKYHRLIAKIHPDAEAYAGKNTDQISEVGEVTAAYHLLAKQGGFEETQDRSGKKYTSEFRQKMKWDAPEHPGAYAEREILQYAEDQDGNPIGIYVAATGKYRCGSQWIM